VNRNRAVLKSETAYTLPRQIYEQRLDRCTLLHKFVEIIEKYDTGMEGLMKRWVSAVKT